MAEENEAEEERVSVLVTGGGRGIGRAIALAFAEKGAEVIVAARTQAEIESVVGKIEALGARGKAVTLDVTDLDSVERGVHQALEFTGGVLDVLVNNAGVFSIHPISEMSPATWYHQIAVNLNGPFHVTLMALKGLEQSRHGHIFNIASVAALQGFEGNTAYCASKYGLRGFSNALRADLAPRGIRVSTIYPGATDTTIFDGVSGEWDRSQMSRPEEVADVVWGAFDTPRDTDVDNVEMP